ncbi:Pisatin demethylase [Podospora australis]|uniref:Pisatin demethylase n=1 Tax=Podospora australis TaxID=1536484 RepID=A0AAN7AE35_9PEZI|nr:Pisatin demethylase [Podospora australis]
MSVLSFVTHVTLLLVTALVWRVIYNVKFHPLARFPGPWYCAVSSLPMALISLYRREPQWLLSIAKKYGRGDTPIRIAPTVLLFSKPSAIREIYGTPSLNVKSGVYDSGMLGPPSFFTILDGNEHRALRKALGGPQWSFGTLKNVWEERIDKLIRLFNAKMTERADRGEPVILCDKGFVENSRDERGILQSFRRGIVFFGFAGRWRGFRTTILQSPLAPYFLSKPNASSGSGFIIHQADQLVTDRENRIENEITARTSQIFFNSKPLNDIQKRGHVTILIQAGADTTGSAMGSTLRYLLANPGCLAKARTEVDAADAKGLLSTPVQYEETRQHLPYIAACIKEGGLRLNPPAPNLLPRVVGPGGATICGVYVPEGTDVATNAVVVQTDPELFGPDPEAFRPERWLESKKKTAEVEAGLFVFGSGPRVCIGKDVAILELYKLIPEIIRRFDMTLLNAGEWVVAGGVAYYVNHSMYPSPAGLPGISNQMLKERH